jgi:hypothetical protein
MKSKSTVFLSGEPVGPNTSPCGPYRPIEAHQGPVVGNLWPSGLGRRPACSFGFWPVPGADF